MATTTESEPTISVKKTPVKRSRKPIDLSTARVADAAQPSQRSVYELCGIRTSNYREKDLTGYQKSLASMNLIDLQDEAYHAGVLPTDNRSSLIDRLERKFIETNARFNPQATSSTPVGKVDQSLREQALKILARGR